MSGASEDPDDEEPSIDDEDPDDEEPSLDEVLDELEDIEDEVESAATRERVRRTMRLTRQLDRRGPFGRVIKGFDRRDAAEALVGSVVFGIPMVIESGTLEAGAFIAANPIFLVATLGFGIAMVVGLLYATEFQRVRIVDPYFGLIPRRVVAVVGIAATTAATMMTGWGFVDWSDPILSLGQVSVTFVGMAIGAALGDILPGS